MRVCTKCGIAKVDEDFYLHNIKGGPGRGRDRTWRDSRCKCSLKASSEYYWAHHEQQRLQQNRHTEVNKEKLRQWHREYYHDHKHDALYLMRRKLSGAKTRCENPNADQYIHYGGRGITFDPNLNGKAGAIKLLDAIGLPPTPQHTLDRIDNDGPYTLNNLRWATPREQNLNQRTVSQLQARIQELEAQLAATS